MLKDMLRTFGNGIASILGLFAGLCVVGCIKDQLDKHKEEQ